MSEKVSKFEFLNRMEAQRKALKIINKKKQFKIDLYGLSRKTIMKWASANNINDGEPVVQTLIELSEKLFFLANKSQQQITDDYKNIVLNFETGLQTLESVLSMTAKKNI